MTTDVSAREGRRAPHFVQFFEDEGALVAALARFVGAGIAGGEGVVVIGTGPHLRALEATLGTSAFDVARVLASSQLVLLDAEETLPLVLDGAAPDGARFDATIRPALERARRGGTGGVRAFGEMVDVLCRRGDVDAAVALDRLWGALVAEGEISLLSGYVSPGLPPDAAERLSEGRAPVLRGRGASAETELWATTERLRDALAAREVERAATESLLRVSTMLGAELELNVIMQRVTDEATQLCGAEAGAFVYDTTDGGGRERISTVSGAQRDSFAEIGSLPIDGLFKLGEGGAVTDKRWPMNSFLSVPVKSPRGDTLGGLVLAHSRPAAFAVDHERMLSGVIAQAAVAIENARAQKGLRRAEKAAENERQRLHALFMVVPAAIWVLRGKDHVIELVNPVARALYPARELVGRPVREAIPEIDDERVRWLDHVFTTGEAYRASDVAASRDWKDEGSSTERFFDVVHEPYRDEGGGIAGVTTFAFEVTEQVRARRRMQTIVEELENANRMKDDFLATLSHELRTPLNAILGWVRMLRADELPAEKRAKALETIERNALAQAQLVEDLLDVSRIVSGKLRLEVTNVDLDQVVAGAIATLTPAAQAKSVEVDHVVDDASSSVLGDVDRLQQVVWNLLSNAIKFTPKGRRVTVTTRRRDSCVELVVADEGQGIDPAFLPHVFERFSQADPTKSRKHMGLGVGLAIVRHLVELHGGRVSVASGGVGQGAQFTVLLPIAPVRGAYIERVPAMRRVPAAKAFAPPRELAGIHALIVEDDDDARELMVHVLAPCNMRISTAASVAEAFEIIDHDMPTIIVSDIGMPGEDGYAFIQKLRARPIERGGRIPAVALTAYTRVEDRARALGAGFNMHVTKPVEPAELVAVLASLSSLFV